MNTVLFVLLLLTGIANVLTTPVHVTIHGMAQSVESLCAADPNTPSPTHIIEVGILPLVDTKYENTTLTVMYDGRSRYKRISLKNTDVVANLLLPPPLDDTSADNLTEQSRGATARLDLFKYELNRYPSNKYIRFHVEVAVGKSLNDTVGTFISYEVGGYVAIMCTQIQLEEDSPGCLDHGRQLRLINSIWPSEHPLQNCTEATFSIDISCPDRPCFNGGKCVRNNATIQCLCPTSFHTGPTCEEIQCPHKPCKNGGSCQLGKIGKGPCKCPETHGGPYCEIELVKSQNRKLQTEVTTLQTENKLLKEKYNRSQGLVRKRKEFGQLLAGLTVNARPGENVLCIVITCLHDGTCKNGICTCKTGYFGNLCQYADLVAICGGECLSGGTCNVEEETCDCNAPYIGQLCQKEFYDTLPKTELTCVSNCADVANPMKPVGFDLNCYSVCEPDAMWNGWNSSTCSSAKVACFEGSEPLSEAVGVRYFEVQQLTGESASKHYAVRAVVVAKQYNIVVANVTRYVTFGAMVPPGAKCSGSPAIGHSLITKFTIVCSGMGDVLFDANFFANSEKSLTNAVVLKTIRNVRSSAMGLELEIKKLQTGNKHNNFTLYILVKITVESGAYVLLSNTLKVRPFSEVNMTLKDQMIKLIDIDNTGTVDERIANNDIQDVMVDIDLALSTIDSEEYRYIEQDTHTKVCKAVSRYMAKIIPKVNGTEELMHALSVENKALRTCTHTETDWLVGESLIVSLFDNFEELAETELSEEELVKISTMLLSGIGEILETVDAHDIAMEAVVEVTNELIVIGNKVGKILLSHTYPDQGQTVIQTENIKLSVIKIVPDKIATQSYGTGYLDLDDARPFEMILPDGLPLPENLTEVGIQVTEFHWNPFFWDNSSADVNLPMINVQIKNQENKPLVIENLVTPITLLFPVEKKNVSHFNLVTHLEKTDSVIDFVFDTSNVLVFKFMVMPNKSTLFSLKCDDIPSVKLHITDRYETVMAGINNGSLAYPEDVKIFRNLYSQYGDLEMFQNQSIENTSVDRIIDFSNNDNSPWYYAGVTVDLNRSDVVEALKRKDLQCLGNEAVTNCRVKLELPLEIQTLSQQCLFWDADQDIWTDRGCKVFPYIDPETLQCLCTHLTSFSGGVFVLPNLVDPLDVALFATFFDNPVVVTAVIIVWVLYFFIIHWARQADRLDRENSGVLWSADGEDNSYVYLMCIATGWWKDAGTTANVFCYLQGSEGVSSQRRLTQHVRPCFQTGFDDWVVFNTKKSLGDLKEVSFWHDNTGSNPHWFLKQVFVVDQQSRTSWTFIYNDWLALDRGSILSTTASVTSVTKEELSEKTGYNFNVKSTRDLRDGHLWLSIFSKPTHSTFTRVQRLTCALSLLLTTMMTNIMFYGIPSDDPEDQVGEGTVSISLSTIVIGIEASLLMFPINLIILQLFIKVKPRHKSELITFEEIADDKGSDDDDEAPVGIPGHVRHGREIGTYVFFRLRNLLKYFTFIYPNDGLTEIYRRYMDRKPSTMYVEKKNISVMSLGSSSSKLTVINEAKVARGHVLPWWSVYVTWTLVVFISLTCSYFVMLYGLKYGHQRSVAWLVSFLAGFAQSAFVTQPLKVFVIAMIITLVFKKAVEFEDYGPEIKRDTDEVYVDSVCQPEQHHVPFAMPLSGRLLAEIKERLRLEWLMDMTIRDICLYIIYMTVVLLMSYGHLDVNSAFQNTDALRNLLISSNCKSRKHYYAGCYDLETVTTVEKFYTYIDEVAGPNLADMTISDHQYATPASSFYLLDTWRMRQLRVEKGSCYEEAQELFKTFDMNVPECTGPYWLGVADTQSYNGTWSNKLPGRPENGTRWSYQSSWQLKTIPVMAKLATYSGGGYVLNMPTDPSLRRDKMNEVFNTDWIDERTRAIILEFTVYNPNADLFATVMLIFEFSSNGAIIPSHQIYSTALYLYSNDYSYVVMAYQFLFLFFNIGFSYIEWNKFQKLGKEYFANFWSYIELIQFMLAYAVIGLFFQRMISIDSIMDDYRNSEPGTYTSFYTAISWSTILGYVLGFLVAVNVMKCIKLLTFNRRAFMVGDAISKSADMLISFMVLAFIVAMSFSHFGFLVFGNSLPGYRDIVSSFMTIFSLSLGVSDVPGLLNVNRILGPIFFVYFVVFVKFCFLTVFVAILNIGISDAKAMLQQRKNKFELLEYIVRKFKTLVNIR